MLFVRKSCSLDSDSIRRRLAGVLILLALSSLASLPLQAQSLGNAGTIVGVVVDPSGAAVMGASVTITNPVS